YELEIIQQPQMAAEFGDAILSRLPITPPIIARLTIRDHAGHAIFPDDIEFMIATLSLASAPRIPANQRRDLLYGDRAVQCHRLQDPQGNAGLFFIFSDVSIRWQGQYQLKVTLSRIRYVLPSTPQLLTSVHCPSVRGPDYFC
ncbi:hypothetical protein FISHEDRAFT_34192, partial [Fistulina hepatica ATCC 64428]